MSPLLAVTLLPLMGVVGAAVDYSRANSIRSSMQSALDASGLMLSKEAQLLTAEQLQAKTVSYFNALFSAAASASEIQVTPNLVAQNGLYTLTLTASAKVDTMFWRVVGASKVSLNTSAEIVWGIRKLNLALALDNTGSMSSSNKMTHLKTAAKNLINTLEAAAKTPGDIKVSIVPFATDVNVGNTISDTYIDWSDWENRNGSCSSSWYSTKSSCENANRTWTPDNHNQWNGCVWDRNQNYDVNDSAPQPASPATLFQAHQASNCPVKMMSLSHDWAALRKKIDAMTPTGNTNVTIGLTWAWHTLSTNAPLNAPEPAPDLDKVVILLTDGENTQNRWTSSSSSIDSRTEKACDNIKAANIRVYTVRVINGDASLLRGCATNPNMYYDVDQASELNSVFTTIAQSLATLRLTK